MPPKPWEQHAGRKDAVRKIRRYLIVCEDEKSSVDYLMAFGISPDVAEITPEGGAGNTDGVVERAIAMKNEAIGLKQPYARIWCVIDRDDFPPQRFNRAFDLARSHRDITVIWSNEAFELWYLLHFCYRDTAIGRNDLVKELGKEGRLGRKYDKADKTVFKALQPHMKKAIQHAKTLERSYGAGLRPERDNPSTNVHELVEAFLRLKEGTAA